ncbi:MAG: hypothetical protein Q8P45_01545 [Candidatus Harrisonbacteria bacterium]|nr:hypothetical protein [Candidatus Harrisonbacteria bacterium]
MTKDKKIILGLVVVLLIIIAIIIGLALRASSDSNGNGNGAETEEEENATSTEEAVSNDSESGIVASENISADISGVWRSQNISGYVLEISPDGALREYQSRKLINTGSWSLNEGSQTIVLTVAGVNYPHTIVTLSSNKLEMRGQKENQTISFERIQ